MRKFRKSADCSTCSLCVDTRGLRVRRLVGAGAAFERRSTVQLKPSGAVLAMLLGDVVAADVIAYVPPKKPGSTSAPLWVSDAGSSDLSTYAISWMRSGTANSLSPTVIVRLSPSP